jgi:dienelactone hydrolase
LLLHEFPGISDHLVRFADELATEWRVIVPSILGRDGHASVPGSIWQLCIRREIHALAAGRTSPVVTWLRALAERVVGKDGRPYGVIGMCLSGGFALAIAVDPRVKAAVVAQPALPWTRLGPVPLPMPHRARREADLGLSDHHLELLRDRLQRDDGLCVRAYRFRADVTSPPVRMASLERLLGDAVHVTELEGATPTAHSTLTKDRNDAAVAEVRAFLRDRLVT